MRTCATLATTQERDSEIIIVIVDEDELKKMLQWIIIFVDERLSMISANIRQFFGYYFWAIDNHLINFVSYACN